MKLRANGTLRTLALAIAVTASTLATSAIAQTVGNGGSVKAPSPTTATTGQGNLNQAVTESRPSQKPGEAKERGPCRGSCNHGGHQH